MGCCLSNNEKNLENSIIVLNNYDIKDKLIPESGSYVYKIYDKKKIKKQYLNILKVRNHSKKNYMF
jgi:hypothetical protein